MTIFNAIYSPNEIFDETISEDMYMGMSKGYGIPYVSSLTDKWFIYSINHCLDKGFDVYRANSFAHIISLFITGMGRSCGTDAYFKEEEIEFFALDLFNGYDDSLKEKDKIRMFFNDMFVLYEEHIESYTIKNQRLQIRCSILLLEQFNNVDGNTANEKLENLLRCYKE